MGILSHHISAVNLTDHKTGTPTNETTQIIDIIRYFGLKKVGVLNLQASGTGI